MFKKIFSTLLGMTWFSIKIFTAVATSLAYLLNNDAMVAVSMLNFGHLLVAFILGFLLVILMGQFRIGSPPWEKVR